MEQTERQLKAILFSDVKSFSAMMSENEERTMRLIKEHRELVRSILARHGGEEHGTAGDSFFVLFASAVNAVRCAVEIQEAFHKRNAGQPPGEQLWIRIGIHLGDIIVDKSDGHVYGEGINIAARTEPQAEPGGICITQDVFQQVQRKIDLKVISIGRQEMKNIVDAPELYRIIVGQVGEGSASPPRDGRPAARGRRRTVAVWIVAAVLIAAAALFLTTRGKDSSGQTSPTAPAAAEPPAAAPVPRAAVVDAVFPGKALVGEFSAPPELEGLATALEAMVAARLEKHYSGGIMRWSEALAIKGTPSATPSSEGGKDTAAIAKLVDAGTIVLGEIAQLKTSVLLSLAFYDARQDRVVNRISERSTEDPDAVMAALEKKLSEIMSLPAPMGAQLSEEEVLKLANTRFGMIKHCYERELARDPDLQGRMTVRFTFDESGRVASATTPVNELGEAVGACVESSFLRLETGYRIENPMTFDMPFMFTSAEKDKRTVFRKKLPRRVDP